MNKTYLSLRQRREGENEEKEIWKMTSLQRKYAEKTIVEQLLAAPDGLAVWVYPPDLSVMAS